MRVASAVGAVRPNARVGGDGEQVAGEGREEEAGVASEREHWVHPLQKLSSN